MTSNSTFLDVGPLAIIQKYVPAFEGDASVTTRVVFLTTLKFFGSAGFDSALAQVILGFGFPIPLQTVCPEPPSLTVMFFGVSVNSAPSTRKYEKSWNYCKAKNL